MEIRNISALTFSCRMQLCGICCIPVRFNFLLRVCGLIGVRGWMAATFAILPGICLAAALVPEFAEPVRLEVKCDPAKESTCPRSGIQHMVLPIPIGDRCASVSVPTDVSPSHSNKPVLLKVYSRESGDVASVQMIESSGDPRLDDAAYDAALDCRFQVGTLEGNPAKTIVKLRYTWDASAAPNDTPEQIAARANHPLQGVTFFGQEAGPQDLS